MNGGPAPEDAAWGDPLRADLSDTTETLLRAALELRPRLASTARRVLKDAGEAEDVVQEALLRFSRARLDDPGAARAWLLATTWRLSIDRLRARERREGLSRAAPVAGPAEPAEETAARSDEARRAVEALARLDDPYRTALRLRYVEGLDFAELAARMGALERTARTWVGRGLARLREELGA